MCWVCSKQRIATQRAGGGFSPRRVTASQVALWHHAQRLWILKQLGSQLHALIIWFRRAAFFKCPTNFFAPAICRETNTMGAVLGSGRNQCGLFLKSGWSTFPWKSSQKHLKVIKLKENHLRTKTFNVFWRTLESLKQLIFFSWAQQKFLIVSNWSNTLHPLQVFCSDTPPHHSLIYSLFKTICVSTLRSHPLPQAAPSSGALISTWPS